MKRPSLHIMFIAIGAIFLASCSSVVVKVAHIPANTPMGEDIFIVGNFNNWDPGNQSFRLKLASDSNYYITLPPAFGRLNYKFSRGDWKTVEKGICGEEIENRTFRIIDKDTISITIDSWNDQDPLKCPRLTLAIEELPKNTPPNDVIAIASNLNSWDPDEQSIFKKDSLGKYYLSVMRPGDNRLLEFKVTRGDLTTSESDEFGNELGNRQLEFGKKDTIHISVKGWVDMVSNKSKNITFIIENLPKDTPENQDIYLSCDLNSWLAADKNYQFHKDKLGRFIFSLPRKMMALEYKITRGHWGSAEVDANGNEIPNRKTNLMDADTVFINIDSWKDSHAKTEEEITIILRKIPESTPENANIYISGNFNNWRTAKLRYMFKRRSDGIYYITLPKEKGQLEFIVNRGSRSSLQIAKDGSKLLVYRYKYSDADSIFVDVDNWKDRPTQTVSQVTLVVNSLPENGPLDMNIYLAPNFNGWNPRDSKLIFRKKLEDGRPYLTIPAKGEGMEYKISRGSWSTVEVDNKGNEIPNRTLYYGFADTVYIDIVKWRDYGGNY